MPFGVLKHFHPMIGYDLHAVMPPGSPVPGPPGPHIAMSSLMGTGATAQMGPTEFSHFGWTILRGSDIGPLIPHAPLAPNCLLPLILLSSGSKSHFGSSQFLVKDKPAACALLVVVNPNLNCADPCPMPLDGVIALTAHFVEMTLGDIISGLVHMAADAALAWAINSLGTKVFSGLSQRLYENALFGPMMAMFERMGSGRVSTWLLRNNFQEMMAKGFFAVLGRVVAADLVGFPLGYSFPVNLFGTGDQALGSDSRGVMEDTHDAIQRYIDSPSVETHDVPPSPDAGVQVAPDASVSDATASAVDPSAQNQGGVCESPEAPVSAQPSEAPVAPAPAESRPADGQGGSCSPDDPDEPDDADLTSTSVKVDW